MRMFITIPSRGRSDLSKSTLRWLPKEYLDRTAVFVHTSEHAKYRNATFNYGFPEVTVIPLDYTYIGEKRKFMAEWALRLGWKKFVMIDDDISQFSVRIKEGETPLRKSTPEDRKEMFDTVAQYLDWYSHVGVSARFHNEQFVGDKPVVVENKRMIRFLAYNTEIFLSCQHNRVPVGEDFDVTLQLLTRGHKNCVLHQWTHDQVETGTAGGCSVYRTLELHNASMERLHSLWPDLTRLREKETKTGRALAKRTELVISWEKAFKEKEIA